MKTIPEILHLVECGEFGRLDRFDFQALAREQGRLESQAELVQSARRALAARLPAITPAAGETSWEN